MASQRQKMRIAAALVKIEEQKKRRRSLWTRDWILRRKEKGAFANLVQELIAEDPPGFQNYCRLSVTECETLLNLIGPQISKKNTRFRESISAKERLMVTLRFLATGDSYRTLMYEFRIADSTLSLLIPEVCKAIAGLRNQFIKLPATPEEWKIIADEFNKLWNFPHCIGALDGKHIVMQAPSNSGSFYFNYKHTHSIVLMALVDANYRVIYADVGANGRISDGGVFRQCSLHEQIESENLNLPRASPLAGRERNTPFVMVADDAFALSKTLMKPYPATGASGAHRIFNYRISRARRIVENFFGHIAQRFRILRKPLMVGPHSADYIVTAICVLHNFLRDRNSNICDFDSEDGETHELRGGSWRSEAAIENTYFPLQRGQNNSSARTPRQIRDEYKDYFISSEGEVPWQYKFI
ncbi:hypothetical protein R5R35_010296 [Gryllus longicercus]|uniref:DDE Tnp4 domain-containing protein n=1 Tax=Gryllus longicercus TaxID=2509291 RepID=A0AAN9Z3X1_9ORTH